MGIAPVEGFPPPRSEQLANASAYSGHAEARPESGAPEGTSQPVSGRLSKQENSVAKKVPPHYELPEDVVEVHQDPEIKSQIIVDYSDKAKNVVLQVPSNEELDVERGIAQEMQQAAKLRASGGTAAAGGEGGKTHGD